MSVWFFLITYPISFFVVSLSFKFYTRLFFLFFFTFVYFTRPHPYLFSFFSLSLFSRYFFFVKYFLYFLIQFSIFIFLCSLVWNYLLDFFFVVFALVCLPFFFGGGNQKNLILCFFFRLPRIFANKIELIDWLINFYHSRLGWPFVHLWVNWICQLIRANCICPPMDNFVGSFNTKCPLFEI